MKRQIVVFERDERHTDSGKAELDFRLVRQALPSGSSPLAVVLEDDFLVGEGQWFEREEVARFAEKLSGYTAQVES